MECTNNGTSPSSSSSPFRNSNFNASPPPAVNIFIPRQIDAILRRNRSSSSLLLFGHHQHPYQNNRTENKYYRLSHDQKPEHHHHHQQQQKHNPSSIRFDRDVQHYNITAVSPLPPQADDPNYASFLDNDNKHVDELQYLGIISAQRSAPPVTLPRSYRVNARIILTITSDENDYDNDNLLDNDNYDRKKRKKLSYFHRLSLSQVCVKILSTQNSATRTQILLPLDSFASVSLIAYDASHFMQSQLLLAKFGSQNSDKSPAHAEDERVPIVQFLHRTLLRTAREFASSGATNSGSEFRSELTKRNNQIDDNGDDDNRHHRHRISKLPNFASLRLLLPLRLIAAFLYFNTPPIESNFNESQNSRSRPIDRTAASSSNSSSTSSNASNEIETSSVVKFAPFNWLSCSSTASQLKFRAAQLSLAWRLAREIPHRPISLALGNVCTAILLDTMLGLATAILLHCYCSPEMWLESAWRYADWLVGLVYDLLRSLRSMPAGLKLNRPLNTALSNFYLYHIYLWRSYIDIIRPAFAGVMQSIFYCGLFGFTCVLSVMTDFFSLVTIHIYCFYGYGCRLYNLQICGIRALWRLFRGKKWNELRSRVDSYSYDNQQLFIGTILFTILLFLLPTVIMYYFVFLLLRFLTLAVQEGLLFFVEHLSSMPLYTIALWLTNSRTIADRINVHVCLDDHHRHAPGSPAAATAGHAHRAPFPSGGDCLRFRLDTQRVALRHIILSSHADRRLAPLAALQPSSIARSNQNLRLSWNEFVRSVLAGRLLHQNLSLGLSLLLFLGYFVAIAVYTWTATVVVVTVTSPPAPDPLVATIPSSLTVPLFSI